MKKFISLLLSTAMFSGSISIMPTFAAEPSLYSVSDVILLQKYLHGKTLLPDTIFKRYDINADSILNVYDWISIKQYLLNERKGSEVIPLEFRQNFILKKNCLPDSWLMGVQKEPVISSSAEQFENNMKALFSEESVSTLMEQYDEDFFNSYDLVLDFRIQGAEDYELLVNQASMTEEKISIEYQKEYFNGLTEQGIQLAQIIIPKITHQYQFDVSILGETEILYTFKSIDQEVSSEETVVIDTYEKYQKASLPEEFSGYTEEFFEENLLFIYSPENGYPQGSQRYGYSVSSSDDRVTITVVQRTTSNSVYTSFTDFIIFNKKDVNSMKLKIRTIVIQE